MENLERLLDLYRNDQRVASLVSLLQQPGNVRLQLLGLIGAQEAFVVSGTYLNDPRSHLLIANDKEEAAYLQNDLAALLEEKTVRFFPDSFKNPMNFEVLSQANVLQRTETIDKISSVSSGGEIVVTYPEALFEQVVNPGVLEQTRITISSGEELDVDFLIDLFTEYGFKREDFVYEPGQYSIRGGIIDIFSYGNDYPYRVELFDNEVESIRTFDPTSQLSQKNIARVSIVPNINTRFQRDQKVSLFRVLPQNTVIWVKDFQILLDKLQQCFEKAEEFSKTTMFLEEEELKEIFRDRAFIYPN
ncbi:MAG TPA: hypothetical protein VJ953_16445, partial [Saprospiraceae bacterium]|nr:hypothetical protein [Saprospiraceae bacterium]